MEANNPQSTPSPEAPAAEVETAGENVVDISKQQRRPSKAELKAQQRLRERVNRWRNAHPEWMARWRKIEGNENATDEQADLAFEQAALRAIDREDYDALSPEKKVAILERRLSFAIQGLTHDIQALQHNDRSITEIFDINLRAMAKMFEKLGIDKEMQGKLILEAQEEIQREQAEAMIKAQQEREKAAAAALNEAVDAKPAENDAPPAPPEAATEFE